jgi:hypothetical protein
MSVTRSSTAVVVVDTQWMTIEAPLAEELGPVPKSRRPLPCLAWIGQ